MLLLLVLSWSCNFSMLFHESQLLRLTDGSNTVDSKMTEIDVLFKKSLVIKSFWLLKWQAAMHSQILLQQCFHINPTILTSHHQIITCFGPLKTSLQGLYYANDKALQNALRQWLWRRVSNFIRWEYLLLFKGRRGLLTKMETTLKSNYVFSNAAVKFWAFLTSNL